MFAWRSGGEEGNRMLVSYGSYSVVKKFKVKNRYNDDKVDNDNN